MPFVSSFPAPSECKDKRDLWFIFDNDNRMLMDAADGSIRIPRFDIVNHLGIEPESALFLGMLDGEPCYAASAVTLPSATVTKEIRFEPLRSLFTLLPQELAGVAIRASHILQWDRMSRFCGACGSQTVFSDTERAKVCRSCGIITYPRISPAVIVAVVKEDLILLVHCVRHPEGLYSVPAGFVEPAETLEECVAREVKEETGIEIDEIRYFASQPWPFPDALMIAFTARFKRGDIVVDGREVTDAAWFKADDLPKIPPKISIARFLIDWFAGKQEINMGGFG